MSSEPAGEEQNVDGDFLIFEAAAAIKELKPGYVLLFEESEMSKTAHNILFNLTTLEGEEYCIELSLRGWRIVSGGHQGNPVSHIQEDIYDSITTLLGVISPAYGAVFAGELHERLTDLQKKELEEDNMKKPEDD